MNILFELKKSKLNKVGKCPIWCRITIKGKRAVFSTGIFVEPERWLAKPQIIKGSSDAVRVRNMKLNQIRTDIETVHLTLEKQKKIITPDLVKQLYLGVDEPNLTFLEAFEKLIERFQALKNAQQIEQLTLDKWIRFKRLLDDYLQKQKQTGLLLAEVKSYLADDLKIYFLHQKKYSNNYARRIIISYKAVLEFAVKREWLTRNPFLGFEMKKTPEAIPEYLSLAELQRLAQYSFKPVLLQKTRDFFVFCAYSGLAYADYYNLVKGINIKIELINGRKWLIGTRKKGINQHYGDFELPLRPECEKLIAQYGGVHQLPLLENQTFNRLLKEVGAILNIEKVMKCHLARKTFAHLCLNEWSLNENVIAAMMGWRDARMLKTYGKVRRNKIDGDTLNW
jgi:integrase/recombinase XerD